MLGDIRQAQNVYIVTGYTDMSKGLRSLVPYVMQNFKMDPYDRGLFLFCGKKCDRLKALLWVVVQKFYLLKRLQDAENPGLYVGGFLESSVLTHKRSNK